MRLHSNLGRSRSDLENARAIYNHIVATVKYDKTGHGWGRVDIYYACDARRGNCTDSNAIFIGYARAVGIQCWAEFYAQGIGWVPVDASEAAKNPNVSTSSALMTRTASNSQTTTAAEAKWSHGDETDLGPFTL